MLNFIIPVLILCVIYGVIGGLFFGNILGIGVGLIVLYSKRASNGVGAPVAVFTGYGSLPGRTAIGGRSYNGTA